MDKNFYNELENIANKEEELENKEKLNFIKKEITKNKNKIKKYLNEKNFSLEDIYEQFSYFYDDIINNDSTMIKIPDNLKEKSKKKIENFIKNNFLPFKLGYYEIPDNIKKYTSIDFINLKIPKKVKEAYNDYISPNFE